MKTTQMNIRIPVDLKRSGDQVAARFGKSPSEVVRAIWTYMVNADRLPECIIDSAPGSGLAQKADFALARQDALLEDFVSATGLSRESFARASREDAREDMYNSAFEEYVELDDSQVDSKGVYARRSESQARTTVEEAGRSARALLAEQRCDVNKGQKLDQNQVASNE